LEVIDKNRLDDGVSVTWVVAGEHVDVTARGASNDAAPNSLACDLAEVLSLGETSLCTLVREKLPGQSLTINLSTAHGKPAAVRPWPVRP
jgi:hypothetical protein